MANIAHSQLMYINILKIKKIEQKILKTTRNFDIGDELFHFTTINVNAVYLQFD